MLYRSILITQGSMIPNGVFYVILVSNRWQGSVVTRSTTLRLQQQHAHEEPSDKGKQQSELQHQDQLPLALDLLEVNTP